MAVRPVNRAGPSKLGGALYATTSTLSSKTVSVKLGYSRGATERYGERARTSIRPKPASTSVARYSSNVWHPERQRARATASARNASGSGVGVIGSEV